MKSVRHFISSHLVVAAIGVLTSLSPVQAQVPQMINHQSFVKVNGANFNGTGYFRFALVDGAGSVSYWSNDGSSTGGSQPTAAVALPVVNGLYSVLLGDTSVANMTLSIPSSVFANADVRLRVWFDDGASGSQQLAPDQRIVSTAYSLMAADVANGAIGASKLAPGSVTAPAIASAAVGNSALAADSVTGAKILDGTITDADISSVANINASKIVGGDLQASRLKVGRDHTLTGDGATIAGGLVNWASGNLATIGGGAANTASGSRATIGGGGGNTASGQLATSGGGFLNTASGSLATIGGGGFNTASGTNATIGGGSGNVATNFATIGGGQENTANDNYATVGGGFRNIASGLVAVVGGGAYNAATNGFATVGGGSDCTASGYGATVGGGFNCTASGSAATVPGGNRNVAAGYASTVGGGESCTASGDQATVPGGVDNVAAGYTSFAAGYRAKANHDGAFVWGDWTGEDIASTAKNQFTARVTGGAKFISGFNPKGFPIGVSLAPKGSQWTSLSDRNAKENFAAVDAREVIEKLAAIPIETWNYKAQDASIRHMGPMAQDFYAAFGLGEDKLGIGTLDADGVAFAALKGLYELVKEKEGVIEQLKRQAAAQEEALKIQKAELDALKRHNAALVTDLDDLKSQVQQVNAMVKSLKNSAAQAVKLSASEKFHQP